MLKPKYDDITAGSQLRLDFGDLLFIIGGAVELLEVQGVAHPYLETIQKAAQQAQREISYWVTRLDGADPAPQVRAMLEARHAE